MPILSFSEFYFPPRKRGARNLNSQIGRRAQSVRPQGHGIPRRGQSISNPRGKNKKGTHLYPISPNPPNRASPSNPRRLTTLGRQIPDEPPNAEPPDVVSFDVAPANDLAGSGWILWRRRPWGRSSMEQRYPILHMEPLLDRNHLWE